MSLALTEIERVKTISKEDFYNHYVKKQKPVVVEQLTQDWPAFKKWNLERCNSSVFRQRNFR